MMPKAIRVFSHLSGRISRSRFIVTKVTLMLYGVHVARPRMPPTIETSLITLVTLKECWSVIQYPHVIEKKKRPRPASNAS